MRLQCKKKLILRLGIYTSCENYLLYEGLTPRKCIRLYLYGNYCVIGIIFYANIYCIYSILMFVHFYKQKKSVNKFVNSLQVLFYLTFYLLFIVFIYFIKGKRYNIKKMPKKYVSSFKLKIFVNIINNKIKSLIYSNLQAIVLFTDLFTDFFVYE